MATALADSKSFDSLLVVHAVIAIATFIVLLTLRSSAAAARRSAEMPQFARRTFSEHREVAGRVVHLLPVSGLALVAISHGTYELYTPFVLVGLCAWALCAWMLEGIAFPAQQEIIALVAAGSSEIARPAARMERAVEIAALAIAVTAIVMVAAPAV